MIIEILTSDIWRFSRGNMPPQRNFVGEAKQLTFADPVTGEEAVEEFTRLQGYPPPSSVYAIDRQSNIIGTHRHGYGKTPRKDKPQECTKVGDYFPASVTPEWKYHVHHAVVVEKLPDWEPGDAAFELIRLKSAFWIFQRRVFNIQGGKTEMFVRTE